MAQIQHPETPQQQIQQQTAKQPTQNPPPPQKQTQIQHNMYPSSTTQKKNHNITNIVKHNTKIKHNNT